MSGPVVPHVVAAPDKFRGTASAPEAAAAMAEGARRAGWTADEVPMSDGGEGLLEALGGEARTAVVTGPLGTPVDAEWRWLPGRGGGGGRGDVGATAVIEMSRAAGRALVPHPAGDDPVRATTTGVGELVRAACAAGATRIVVGCGGSATTDGGWGAVEAVGNRAVLDGVEMLVACDVTTPFRRAGEVFGPQKGATPAQVQQLTARLDALAGRYRRDFGVDVDAVAGTGAAGGLAGGLVALGARIVPGFDLVADLAGLEDRMARATVVVTGEGHLDPPSFSGKVPGGVLALAAGRCPVLCVVGDAEAPLLESPPAGMTVVSLTERFGPVRARAETLERIADVVEAELSRFCP
ncbi:MAG TPA: glycerate kinase [Acidimicrobiales bacterium]|nr:glycerate kinase [Acidimicrobiales bacterium]